MSKQMIEILCLSGQGHVEHCSIEMFECISTVRSYSPGSNYDHTFVRWAHCPLLSLSNPSRLSLETRKSLSLSFSSFIFKDVQNIFMCVSVFLHVHQM